MQKIIFHGTKKVYKGRRKKIERFIKQTAGACNFFFKFLLVFKHAQSIQK